MLEIVVAVIAIVGTIIGGAIAGKSAQYLSQQQRQQQLEVYDQNRQLAIIGIAAQKQKQTIFIENLLLVAAVAFLLLIMFF